MKTVIVIKNVVLADSEKSLTVEEFSIEQEYTTEEFLQMLKDYPELIHIAVDALEKLEAERVRARTH